MVENNIQDSPAMAVGMRRKRRQVILPGDAAGVVGRLKNTMPSYNLIVNLLFVLCYWKAGFRVVSDLQKNKNNKQYVCLMCFTT